MLISYLKENIDEEIAKAENGAESNSNAMYLASLYYLKNCMADTPKVDKMSVTEPVTMAYGNAEPIDDSFLLLFKSKDMEQALNVLAEYFEVLKIINPKSYGQVMQKIRQL